MIANEEPLAGFAPFRLDSHLILNALNSLGMTLYTELGREIPAVALLADYLIAEHGIGQNLNVPRISHSLADEWTVCKSMLLLKASLVGTRLSFTESGDLDAVRVPDHALAVLLREVFAAWPGLAAHDVRLAVHVESPASLRLSALVKLQHTTGRRYPFVRALQEAGKLPHSDLLELEVASDDGYGWALDIKTVQPARCAAVAQL